MPSLFVVSYYYPPYHCVGAIRVSKLTKHLSTHGWQPIVLTVDYDNLPPTLPIEIPHEWIHRAPAIDVNYLPKLVVGRGNVAVHGYSLRGRGARHRLLTAAGALYRQVVNFPDAQIGWFPHAVRAGRRLIDTLRPDAIYSSALPPTSHLVASQLARESGLPWVAEFRDLWTDNHNFRRVWPLRAVERWLEDRVISRADRLVTVTPDWGERLHARFGKPVSVVPNGIDLEDFPKHVPLRRNFTLTYTGTVYPGKQHARPLFRAVARLRAAGKVPENFSIRFVGRNVEAVAADAGRLGVSDLIEVVPPVDRRTSIRMQMESTALLLLLWESSEELGWYPAKMFEYFGAGRPILALGPHECAAAEVIRRVNGGRVAAADDEVECVLAEWLARFESGGPEALPETGDGVRQFERSALVGDLARSLDLTLAAHRGSRAGSAAWRTS